MRRFLVLAAALALVGCAPASAAPPADNLSPRVAALEAKVAELEARVSALEASPPPAPTVAPTPTPTPTASPPVGTFVAPTGADTNAGTLASPWKTIGKAAATAPLGSTVYLRAGTYGPAVINRDVDFTSYPGEWAYVSGLGTSVSRVLDISGNGVSLSRITVEDAPTQWGAGVWITGDDVTLDTVELRENKSFGAKVVGASNVTFASMNVHHNDTGIEGAGALPGFVFRDSWIHDHNTMVVNTVGGDDDRGASAFVFFHATGPISITGNDLWNGRAVSSDYGHDGETFNIYGSSGITIDDNRIWDNDELLESGTDGPANSFDFTNNVAWKPAVSDNAVQGNAKGLNIRACRTCAFAGNRLYDMDNFGFLIVTGNFTAGVINDAVTFTGNQVEQSEPKAISIVDWTGVSVTGNTYYLEGTGTVGYATTESVVNGPNPTRP